MTVVWRSALLGLTGYEGSTFGLFPQVIHLTQRHLAHRSARGGRLRLDRLKPIDETVNRFS
jgi:hypothetical protein